MKKIHYIALALCSLAVFASCNDLLDLQQKGVTTPSTFYKTDDEAMAAAANLYSAFAGNAYNYEINKTGLADEVYIGGTGFAHNDVNEYCYTADNSSLQDLFTGYYSILYAANLITDNVEPDTDVKKQVYAEGLFFRAWTHFELVTMWGPAPCITEARRDDYRVGNTPVEETWAQIEKDLTEAIPNLPSKTGLNDKETCVRVTKETAEALLGKAYLWQGKNSEAAAEFEKVINSKLYDLMPLGDDGYLGYARCVNDNNCEVLLQINRIADASLYSFVYERIAIGLPTNMFTPAPLLDENGNPVQYWGVVNYWTGQEGWITVYNDKYYANPFYSGAWGFNSQVHESLVYDFQDNATANGGVQDIRFKTTLLNPDQIYEDYGMAVDQPLNGSIGWFTTKHTSLTENWLDGTYAGFQNNDMYMRYAEVLLLAAEAQLITGNSSKALEYVNKIRVHAGEPTLSSVTLDQIKMEKRLELCMEGVRYQDLIRWGDAATVLKDQGKKIWYYGPDAQGKMYAYVGRENPEAGFKTGKNELLPFPAQELNVNPNIVQNPGY